MWHFAVDMEKPLAIRSNLQVDSEHDAVVALVGENGAGKSTLLRALAGFFGGTQGDLSGPPWGRPLAFVPQQPSLLPHRTVKEQVEWILGQPLRADASVQDWIDILGVGDVLARLPGALSGGYQQRVQLLRAIASHPKILALDEALSQIDAPSRDKILGHLSQWAQRGSDRLLIVASHQFMDLAHWADQVWIMAQGRILRKDSSAELMAHPKTWQVAALVGYVALVRVDSGYWAVEEGLGTVDPPGVRIQGAVTRARLNDVVVEAPSVVLGRQHFIVRRAWKDFGVGDPVTFFLPGVEVTPPKEVE